MGQPQKGMSVRYTCSFGTTDGTIKEVRESGVIVITPDAIQSDGHCRGCSNEIELWLAAATWGVNLVERCPSLDAALDKLCAAANALELAKKTGQCCDCGFPNQYGAPSNTSDGKFCCYSCRQYRKGQGIDL